MAARNPRTYASIGRGVAAVVEGARVLHGVERGAMREGGRVGGEFCDGPAQGIHRDAALADAGDSLRHLCLRDERGDPRAVERCVPDARGTRARLAHQLAAGAGRAFGDRQAEASGVVHHRVVVAAGDRAVRERGGQAGQQRGELRAELGRRSGPGARDAEARPAGMLGQAAQHLERRPVARVRGRRPLLPVRDRRGGRREREVVVPLGDRRRRLRREGQRRDDPQDAAPAAARRPEQLGVAVRFAVCTAPPRSRVGVR